MNEALRRLSRPSLSQKCQGRVVRGAGWGGGGVGTLKSWGSATRPTRTQVAILVNGFPPGVGR